MNKVSLIILTLIEGVLRQAADEDPANLHLPNKSHPSNPIRTHVFISLHSQNLLHCHSFSLSSLQLPHHSYQQILKCILSSIVIVLDQLHGQLNIRSLHWGKSWRIIYLLRSYLI